METILKAVILELVEDVDEKNRLGALNNKQHALGRRLGRP